MTGSGDTVLVLRPPAYYEPAGKAPDARECQPGALALGRAIRTTFPELLSMTAGYGCWNPRKIAGSSSWSLHAEGRALDVGVPVAARQVADRLATELLSWRSIYGVQRIIWNRRIWTVERTHRWHALKSSTNPHTDHMHIELYWAAARRPVTIQAELEHRLRKSR